MVVKCSKILLSCVWKPEVDKWTAFTAYSSNSERFRLSVSIHISEHIKLSLKNVDITQCLTVLCALETNIQETKNKKGWSAVCLCEEAAKGVWTVGTKQPLLTDGILIPLLNQAEIV